jgi:phosphoribosylaminoimidazole-succinocarboxamide synthase
MHGQETAANRGLILVDTKYEFGTDERGDLVLIDEIHTPDSSRYWQLASYGERMKAGQEPEYFDKDFCACGSKSIPIRTKMKGFPKRPPT